MSAQQSHRVVVLGTGTGVGKTYVTSQLARALQARKPDLAVAALKPVETGFVRETSDASALATSSNVALPAVHPLIALPEGVSPHLAARRAGAPAIDPQHIVQWLDRWQRAQVASDLVCLVETAGGTFSPLAPGVTNFELARALDPALWLLIAPDALGVLHDVTATLEACRLRGRLPDLVALSSSREADASTGSNAAELDTLGIAHVSACVPRHGHANALAEAVLARCDDARR